MAIVGNANCCTGDFLSYKNDIISGDVGALLFFVRMYAAQKLSQHPHISLGF